MTVRTPEELQELASIEDPDELAVTAYVEFDPFDASTKPDHLGRVNPVVDEVDKLRESLVDGSAKRRLDATVERLRELLTSAAEDVHDRGLMVYVADGRDGVRWMFEPPGNHVHVGRRLALVTLAAQAARPARALVLLAGREQGMLLEVSGHRVREVFDDSEPAERRHDQGGWAQANLQRWNDRAARLHIREVIQHLERVHPELGRPPIVVSANEESVGAVRDQLPKPLAEAVVEWIGDVHDWDDRRLADQVGEILERLAAERQRELLERYAAQRGRGGAPDRPSELLAAASDGRVEWLIVWPSQQIDAARCPTCSRLLEPGWRCPFDDTPLELEPDGISALAAAVLRSAGNVWLADLDVDPVIPDVPAAVTRF
jgi:hypothetical protein